MSNDQPVAPPPEFSDWEWIGRESARVVGLQTLQQCVNNLDEFWSKHWDKVPLHSRKVMPQPSSLFSLEDADNLLMGGGVRWPAFRLVRDDYVIPPTDYLRSARLGPATVNDLPNVDVVLEEFSNGATIVIQGLHETWTPVSEFCDKLALGIGHPVKCNAYMTPPRSVGFSRHYDMYDAFIVQVSGSKKWAIWAPAFEHPLDTHGFLSLFGSAAAIPETGFLVELVLEPGDVLYLPRGFIHAPRTAEETSLHLTVGILATSPAEVLHQVIQNACYSASELRASIPVTTPYESDWEAMRKSLHEDIEKLHEALDVSTDLGENYFWSRRQLLSLGRLRHAVAAQSGVPDEVLVRRPETFVLQLRRAGSYIELRGGDRLVAVDRTAECAVRRALDGFAHSIGELRAEFPDLGLENTIGKLLSVGFLKLS